MFQNGGMPPLLSHFTTWPVTGCWRYTDFEIQPVRVKAINVREGYSGRAESRAPGLSHARVCRRRDLLTGWDEQ